MTSTVVSHKARRALAGLAAAFILAIAQLPRDTSSAFQCGSCNVTTAHTPTGTVFDFYGPSFETATWRAAAQEWSNQLGVDVSIGSGGSWRIQLVAPEDMPGAWGDAPTGARTIYIRSDALTKGSGFVKFLITHEMGHALGFNHTTCSVNISVMTVRQPDPRFNGGVEGTTGLGCAIENYITETLRTVRRDADNDGYSPDGSGGDWEMEACDYDGSRNPGVVLSCSGLTPNGDMNCNTMIDEDELWPTCESCPLLIDVGGDGFDLTDTDGGAYFDLNSDGIAERLPWTVAGTDDSWLFLDRNGNGVVDNGGELFGNFTPQPSGSERNGFLALAVYDLAENGGNADGRIDTSDSVYSSLRLWSDSNHDGVSQTGEIQSLDAAGVLGISLDYRDSHRRDRWGNEYRYRAKIEGLRSMWVVDVFLSAIGRK